MATCNLLLAERQSVIERLRKSPPNYHCDPAAHKDDTYRTRRREQNLCEVNHRINEGQCFKCTMATLVKGQAFRDCVLHGASSTKRNQRMVPGYTPN